MCRFQIDEKKKLKGEKTDLPRKPGCCLTARFLLLEEEEEEANLVDEDDQQMATCIASKETERKREFLRSKENK